MLSPGGLFLGFILLVTLLALAPPARATDAGGVWVSPTIALNRWASRQRSLTADVVGAHPLNVNNRARGERFRPRSGETVTSFWSLEDFALDTNVPPGAWVMYDLEYNESSPATSYELEHPKDALRAFVALAHARGLKVVFAPAPSLVRVPRQTWCPLREGESSPEAFIRCRLAGFAASIGTDLLLLQSQRLECDLEGYRWFVRAAALQDPATVAELTVVWPDPCVTPRVLFRAWRSVRPYVAGFALWSETRRYAMIPQIRPWAKQTATALEFFGLVEETL